MIQHLQQLLRQDIGHIQVPGEPNDTLARARERLNAVAQHSPAFLCLLAEPWLGAAMTARTQQLMEHCARIHLYARVLDDAIDEPEPVYRLQLLRAQPMFWRAVQQLGAMLPRPVADAAEQLIAETVTAVQLDDAQRSPQYWGSKNHHMLLMPLVLSGHNAAYRACQTSLSHLIALVQAGDEWRQGEFDATPLHAEFLEFLTDCLDTGALEQLTRHGWRGATERIVWNARQLLNVLTH